MRRLFAVAALILLSGIVMAQTLPESEDLAFGEHKIDLKIEPGDNKIYIAEVAFGDRLEVELDVLSGGAVDFFLLNDYTAYETYLSNGTEIAYLDHPYTQFRTTGIEYSYTSNLDDTLYIVIDNTALTASGATPEGTVEVGGNITLARSPWTLRNILLVTAVIIIIIVFFVKLTFRPKKIKPAQLRVKRKSARQGAGGRQVSRGGQQRKGPGRSRKRRR